MELLTEGLGGQNEGHSQLVKHDCRSFDRRGWVGKSTRSVLNTSRLDRSPLRKFNLLAAAVLATDIPSQMAPPEDRSM
ncbi:MAG: hypothetical protein ACK5ZC_10365 [Pirellulaceae bacterium]|jgi:hypothetical protein